MGILPILESSKTVITFVSLFSGTLHSVFEGPHQLAPNRLHSNRQPLDPLLVTSRTASVTPALGMGNPLVGNPDTSQVVSVVPRWGP